MTWWYLIRALGFVSLIALTASTAWGALASGGRGDAVAMDRRLVRQLVHRSVGVLGLVLLGAHLLIAVADSISGVPLRAAFVPFGSSYRPVAIGLGVLALYAVIVAIVSGLLRRRVAQSGSAVRRWRLLHAAAYLGWVLSMAHGLWSGTDTGTWWGIGTYVGCAVAVAGAVIVRLTVPARRARDLSGQLRLTTGVLR